MYQVPLTRILQFHEECENPIIDKRIEGNN